MKQFVTAFALAITAGAVFAQAAATAAPAAPAASKAPTAQQSKMGHCATENKGKKGQDYKDGMKACLAK
jgi:hypothetical protein